MEPRTCLCGDLITDDYDWCNQCENCIACCECDEWEDDLNPPDEGQGSIYVDPEGLR